MKDIKIVALAAVVALGSVGTIAIIYPPTFLSDVITGFAPGFGFSIEAVENLIHSWGPWGALGSIGLMILHSFVPFPSEVLAIANGMIYGPLMGTALTWTGAMLGAYLAFGLARILGQPFVRRMVSSEKLARFDTWSHTKGGIALLASRLVPVIAFNLINYVAGLTSISWWTFTWATGLGILPLSILMAVFGHNMTAIPWWLWPLFALAAIGSWIVLAKLGKSGTGNSKNRQ